VIVEALHEKHNALSSEGPERSKDWRALCTSTSPVRILSRRKTVQKYSVVYRIAA
jgi:hypothetical protein